MYAALWRVLPKPTWLKVLILTVATLAIVSLLMFFVFPWVDALMTPSTVTVNE